MIVRKTLFAGLAALLLSAATGAAPARADPHDDQDRVNRELAQVLGQYEDVTDVARTALTAYQTAAAQLPAAQRRLADAKGTLAARQVQARQAQRDADAAQAAAVGADSQVVAADADVDAARQSVSDLTAQVYQGSGILGFNALLESGDTGSLADAVGYLDELAGARTAALGHFVAARGARSIAANAAHRARDTATQSQAQARDALVTAQVAQQQAQQDADTVQGLVDRQQQALADANAQRATVLDHYNQLKQEAADIQAQLAALARAHGAPAAAPPLRPGAILLMPVRGASKSSEFGMRYDPYYHVWQLHAGVDLAAPGGTPDLRGPGRQGHLGRLARRLRQLHLYRPRPLPGAGADHLLRPPVEVPGQRRSVRAARPGDRAGRYHRRVHRLPPALRGAPERHPGAAAGLAARLPVLS